MNNQKRYFPEETFMPASFEIYKDKKGEYRFRLKATNGEVIATGEGYSTFQNCKKGIASVMTNAPRAVIKNTAANEELIRAADNGNLAGVKKALKEGADPNFRDKEGETPLIEATEAGNLLAVKELVKKGAKLNLQDDEGETALHEAIEEGHKDIVKYLVQAGARKNVKDKKGRTATDLAQKKGISLNYKTLTKK